MIDWILTFEFNSLLGLLLYWLPAAFCATAYTSRTWRNYRKDVADRAAADSDARGYYSPTDTVGVLLGRAFVTVTPGVNLCAGVFDAAPDVFSDFFAWLGRVFDIPLVPRRKP